jgi:hypothetical protein
VVQCHLDAGNNTSELTDCLSHRSRTVAGVNTSLGTVGGPAHKGQAQFKASPTSLYNAKFQKQQTPKSATSYDPELVPTSEPSP